MDWALRRVWFHAMNFCYYYLQSVIFWLHPGFSEANTFVILGLMSQNQIEIGIWCDERKYCRRLCCCRLCTCVHAKRKVRPHDQLAELFLYDEPLPDVHYDFHLREGDMEWYTYSVKSLSQCVLRKNWHSLFLVRWALGTEIPFHRHGLGEEIYVLKGELFDRSTSLKKGEWKYMLPRSCPACGGRNADLAKEWPSLMVVRSTIWGYSFCP